MKKGLLISLISIFLLCGCGKNDEVVVTECTLTNNNLAANYSLNSEYKIYSKNDVVTKVETVETVTSSSSAMLDYFESYLITTYESYNNTYGGYTNKVTKTDDQLKSTTTIDYSVMDIKKYAEDNSAIKSYLNSNNELSLDAVKKIYTSMGATCK